MAVLADATTAAAAAVTAAEFALLDGGTARQTANGFSDGDGLIHNDNGVQRMTNVTKLVEYVLPKITGGDVAVDSAGAATIQANAVESGMLNNNVISGQSELSLADVAEDDEILISDGGVLKKFGIDNLRTFINAGSTPNAIGNADATLAVGVNYSTASVSQDRTLTLPASPVEGQSVRVKANADMAGGAYIIARAGSQTIDGETSIKLESPHAAVELIYVGSDLWKIF